MNVTESVLIAAINAARDITVAKINAKGAKFDGYTKPVNWFDRSLIEVIDGINGQIKETK